MNVLWLVACSFGQVQVTCTCDVDGVTEDCAEYTLTCDEYQESGWQVTAGTEDGCAEDAIAGGAASADCRCEFDVPSTCTGPVND